MDIMKPNIEVTRIQYMLNELGYYNGAIDGIWGKLSSKGYQQVMHDLQIEGATLVKPEVTHTDEPFVLPDGSIPEVAKIGRYSNADMQRAFGVVGEGTIRTELPYPMRLAWDTDTVVSHTQVHHLVARALQDALQAVLDHYGATAVTTLGLDLLGGVFNKRHMRGGTTWSSHAWGVSIDINPAGNPFRAHTSDTTFVNPAYTEFARIMVQHGFGTIEYDLMHWQYKIN